MKISTKQIVKNINEKYANKTGDKTATYGNIADKVDAAIGGGATADGSPAYPLVELVGNTVADYTEEEE